MKEKPSICEKISKTYFFKEKHRKVMNKKIKENTQNQVKYRFQ